MMILDTSNNNFWDVTILPNQVLKKPTRSFHQLLSSLMNHPFTNNTAYEKKTIASGKKWISHGQARPLVSSILLHKSQARNPVIAAPMVPRGEPYRKCARPKMGIKHHRLILTNFLRQGEQHGGHDSTFPRRKH